MFDEFTFDLRYESVIKIGFMTLMYFGGPRSLDRNWADYKRESRRLSFPGYAARSLLLDAITFLS